MVSFNEKILCLFAIDLTKLIFMSRKVGDVVSLVKVDHQVLSSFSLFNLSNDQMMFVIKMARTTSQQKVVVRNSRGEILIEKSLPFFVSEISRTANGTIVMNKGTSNVARVLNNQDNVETIKFKTF